MRRFGFYTPSWHLARRSWQCVAGFTLLEIMIAMVVFSVGLLGMSSMQLTAIRLNATAQLKARIATVGQEHMEDLLAQVYNSPVLADPSPVGIPTTYCVLYPDDGLSPCRAPDLPPPQQGSPPYCIVTPQPSGGNQCDDRVFLPPTVGYKVWWSVDKNSTDTLVHVNLIVSQRHAGQRQTRTFALSFAKSAFN